MRSDIVILTEGDRVPADGVVLLCVSLSVDESLDRRICSRSEVSRERKPEHGPARWR